MALQLGGTWAPSQGFVLLHLPECFLFWVQTKCLSPCIGRPDLDTSISARFRCGESCARPAESTDTAQEELRELEGDSKHPHSFIAGSQDPVNLATGPASPSLQGCCSTSRCTCLCVLLVVCLRRSMACCQYTWLLWPCSCVFTHDCVCLCTMPLYTQNVNTWLCEPIYHVYLCVHVPCVFV